MTGLLGLTAFILPVLIGMINEDESNKKRRFLYSFIVCVLAGVFVEAAEMGFSFAHMTFAQVFDSMSDSVMYMIALVKLSYEAIWDNTRVSKIVIQEENKTLLEAAGLK